MRNTWVYDAASAKMLPKRLAKIERELRAMRRDTAVLVGYMAIALVGVMAGTLVAPYAWYVVRMLLSANLM